MAGLRPPERDIGMIGAPVGPCLALLGLFGILFLVFALLERLGLAPGFVPVAVIASALALFAISAIVSPGRRAVDYYVGDRSVAPAIGGLAATSAVAGLLVVGVAGGAFATGGEIMISAVGFLLGLVLSGLLFAPRLALMQGFSATDFLAARFAGPQARLAAAFVAFLSSFLLLLAHLEITGPLLSALLNLSPPHGVYLATALTLIAVLPGGMRSVTWTQMVQYMVIAFACLAPAGFLSTIGGQGEGVGVSAAASLLTRFNAPFEAGGPGGVVLPVLALAVGTASLPFLLVRGLMAPNARDARASLMWAVMFGVVLMAGGLILGQVVAAQAGSEAGGSVGGDPLLLATPIFAGMPAVLAGLVMAGLLAALLALGQSALLGAASAVSHDLWDSFVDLQAPEGRRLFAARLLAVAVAFAAARITLLTPADPPALIGWGLALAAAGNFAPLLLAIYWRRCTPWGGALGMVAGSAIVLAVCLLETAFPLFVKPAGVAAGLGPIGAAAIGVSVSTLVSVLVSLVKWERIPWDSLRRPFTAARPRHVEARETPAEAAAP